MSEVSVSLKLLHNHNTSKIVLQISFSKMPVVKASLKLSFLYQYVSISKSETMVQHFVSHSICFWI